MTKKDFIALADLIRGHNRRHQIYGYANVFGPAHLDLLADFCQGQNPAFKRDRWLGYIKGECGPNGGPRK